MTDRRTTLATPRVADESLRGHVFVPRYVVGKGARVIVPVADLLSAPDGPRDRQLLFGQGVYEIERYRGHAFVQSFKDGYCGYVAEAALGKLRGPTHRVIAPATHLYGKPKVQARARAMLHFGSMITVKGGDDAFAQVPEGYIPAMHLAPVDEYFADPVAVARMFLGTPYLWGGNSRDGLDCSGLVQAALLACDIICPGDSDQQMMKVGRLLDEGEALQPGDLLFWQGHVAMVADDHHIIHSTAYKMAVILEETEAAIARIAALGFPILARRRPVMTPRWT